MDAGANNGQSILSVLAVLPGARIVAFEPDPAHAKDLQRLVDRFPGQVQIEQCGLAAAPGEAALYWPVYNRKPMLALASFDRAAAADWLGPDTVYGYRPDLLHLHEAPLRLQRLDDFGLDPDLTRMDVQGLEEQVIEGGLETIREHLPVIVAESLEHESPGVRALAPLGYRLWDPTRSAKVFLLPPAGPDA